MSRLCKSDIISNKISREKIASGRATKYNDTNDSWSDLTVIQVSKSMLQRKVSPKEFQACTFLLVLLAYQGTWDINWSAKTLPKTLLIICSQNHYTPLFLCIFAYCVVLHAVGRDSNEPSTCHYTSLRTHHYEKNCWHGAKLGAVRWSKNMDFTRWRYWSWNFITAFIEATKSAKWRAGDKSTSSTDFWYQYAYGNTQTSWHGCREFIKELN